MTISIKELYFLKYLNKFSSLVNSISHKDLLNIAQIFIKIKNKKK